MTTDQREQLAARGRRVVDGAVTAVEVTDDRICGLRLAGGRVVAVDAVAVMPRVRARSPLLDSLGLHGVEHESGMGTYIPTGPGGVTDVPGVRLAGNVVDLAAAIAQSVAAGSAVAVAVKRGPRGG